MTLEQIYDGIKLYVEENLQPILEDYDGDGLKVPMFKQVLRSTVLDLLGLNIHPTLMMEYGRVTVERETVGADRYTLPITFYCVSLGSNTEDLQHKSERYVWSLKRLFEEDDTVGGLVDRSDIEAYEFSPSLKRQQVFMHAGLITVNFDVLLQRY